MIANIIAVIGLFIGIAYTASVLIRVPHLTQPGVKIEGIQILLAALGWTMFASAMWIFK
jgi:hypothetical protein